MTVFQLRKQGKAVLRQAGMENTTMEADLLLAHALDCSRQDLLLQPQMELNAGQAERYAALLQHRTQHEPLQYLIGEWDFLRDTFLVGPGVLIPRPETEQLTQYVISQLLKGTQHTVYDLCAGSGCIGLSIAKACPDKTVYLIEKSEEAFFYLERNRKALQCDNAVCIQGDIQKRIVDLPLADCIVSNPPYICSDVLPGLQQEVQNEPQMALDGGADGLEFYRILMDVWIPMLRPEGLLALECGEGQAKSIVEMLPKQLRPAQIQTDDYGKARFVVTRKCLE